MSSKRRRRLDSSDEEDDRRISRRRSRSRSSRSRSRSRSRSPPRRRRSPVRGRVDDSSVLAKLKKRRTKVMKNIVKYEKKLNKLDTKDKIDAEVEAAMKAGVDVPL